MEVVERYSGLHAELTQKVIGVFYDVANELGHGFLESVYKRALVIALGERGVRAQEEVPIPVFFHGQKIGIFHADVVVEGVVVLELKTADDISAAHEAQLLHYLRSSRMEVGLVLAFGQKAKIKRVSMSNDRKHNMTPALSINPL